MSSRTEIIVLRVVVAMAVGINLHALLTGDVWWARAFAAAIALLTVWIWVIVERRRRTLEQGRWAIAAASPDPVAALAQSDFTRSLRGRDRRTLVIWQLQHDFRPTDEEIAAAPEVVQEYYAIAANPPREKRS